MVKILIPLAVQRVPRGAKIPIHMVRETYLQRLLACGLEPALLPTLFPRELIDNIYKQCAGVLCTGGGDIDPKYYHAERHEKTENEDPRRDEVELYIARRAVADRKPFLGICRGCQVLAVAQGGTLIQHLPDQFPDEEHGVSEGGTYDTLLDPDNGHSIKIDETSLFGRLVGKLSIHVPSGHHQAVDMPGKNIRVVARSPGGVVEVIEYADPSYFCIGIQGHPEVFESGDMAPVFEGFAKAAREWKGVR